MKTLKVLELPKIYDLSEDKFFHWVTDEFDLWSGEIDSKFIYDLDLLDISEIKKEEEATVKFVEYLRENGVRFFTIGNEGE